MTREDATDDLRKFDIFWYRQAQNNSIWSAIEAFYVFDQCIRLKSILSEYFGDLF